MYILLGFGFFAVACRQALGVDDFSFDDDAAAATSSGGSSMGGTAGQQGAVGASSSGAASSGSGGAGGNLVIPCGAMQCPADSEHACCWSLVNGTGQCVTGIAGQDGCGAQVGQTRLECHASEDCPTGNVCCASQVYVMQIPIFGEAHCSASCNPLDHTVLCDQVGETAPDCPVVKTNSVDVQTVCQPSMYLPPNYFACVPP